MAFSIGVAATWWPQPATTSNPITSNARAVRCDGPAPTRLSPADERAAVAIATRGTGRFSSRQVIPTTSIKVARWIAQTARRALARGHSLFIFTFLAAMGNAERLRTAPGSPPSGRPKRFAAVYFGAARTANRRTVFEDCRGGWQQALRRDAVRPQAEPRLGSFRHRFMSTELFTTPAATPLVEIAALDVTYRDGLRAVEGVSFSLRAGEFVAVVGPSGCGKSTLLRSIAGLVRPSRRTFDRRRAGAGASTPGSDADVVCLSGPDPASLAQRLSQHRPAIGTGRRGPPRDARDARVRRAIELVGLADFAGSYPAELSGGMRMRVSLARAVVTDPELLLLDEPFAALDDITRQTLNEELLSLWESRHWTGIFVTHNIAEAIFLSQRVLVLTRRPGRDRGRRGGSVSVSARRRAACRGRFRPSDRRDRRSSARGQPMKKRLGQL